MSKVALVVGGTGGLGAAVVAALAENGLKVYGTYFTNAQEAARLESAHNCRFFQCDIRDKRAVQKAVQEIISADSQIDVVVNCAVGALKLKRFESLTEEEIAEDIGIILMGAVNVFKATVGGMVKRQSGTIVNILSKAIDTGQARMSSYVAAKSGLLGLCRSLAAELGAIGVRIVSISPTLIETELVRDFPQKLLEIEREKTAEKKLLQPSELAELVWPIIAKPETFSNGLVLEIGSRADLREWLARG